MNVDEAMETAKAYLVAEEQCQEPLFTAEVVAITLAKEVERLRDENEWMGIAGQQMARHLAEAKAQLAAAKAASVVIVSKLRNEIDHAACNDMRLPPMFGQSKGELAVRVGALQAVIDSTTPPTT